MKEAFIAFIRGFNYFVGFYYLIFNSVYSILLCISLIVLLRYIGRLKYAPVREIAYSPLTPPVSIIIPCYNEEALIVNAVKAALSVKYPFFDVIVVNDGSTDRTLDVLINTFGLKRIDVVYRQILKSSAVKGFYYNPEMPALIVVDKEKGGKGDAINCGINVSRSPYFSTIDADSVIEPDALIRLMVPVIESTVPVIACGGVVRILNGIRLEDGEVKKIDLPRKSLVLFQVVEYLRAFLFGRVGWDTLNSILLLSGTFSLFNKNAVISAGGFRVDRLTEDMEIILRLHKFHIKNRRPYRIKFISDPICWTVVPEKFGALRKQRIRWHMGMMQCLFEYKDIIFNPKYGRLGMFIFPYYFFFEMLGSLIEVIGYIVVPSSFLLGILSTELFLLFLFLAITYGIFLSITGIFLEEFTYRRYPEWEHLFILLLFGILENLGYRQINSLIRFKATILYFLRKREWQYVRQN